MSHCVVLPWVMGTGSRAPTGTQFPCQWVECHNYAFRPGVSMGGMSGISGSGPDGSPGSRLASPGAERPAGGRRPHAQAPDDSSCGAPNPLAISCSRIFLRPRCSRDITVPTGVPMISAISR